jgi:hypothetical protein
MEQSKNIINKLIDQGWICFNPFNMDISEPRYAVCLEDTKQLVLSDTDITELITDCIIQAETNFPYPEAIDFKDNIYIDIYAYDSFAEVTWQVNFNTIKELKHYKKVTKQETIYYIDTETQTPKEL